MNLLTALTGRTAIMLVVGFLVPPESWATPSSPHVNGRLSARGSYIGSEFAASARSRRFSSSDDNANAAAQGSKAAARQTVTPTLAGSCQELAERESAAYLDRVKARDHSAARDIARRTADRCLAAGDLKRAKDWFLTARAVGPRGSETTAEQDEQWRRRYKEGVARQRPQQSSVAAAEARMAARRPLDARTDPALSPRWTASNADRPAPPDPHEPTNQRLDWMHRSWMAAAGGFALFGLAAAVLFRRNGAAVFRGNERGANARTSRGQGQSRRP
jgi:hypothetical protein